VEAFLSDVKIHQSLIQNFNKTAESLHVQNHDQEFMKVLQANGASLETRLVDFFKGQFDHFVNQAHFVEGKAQQYARGEENIENVTPLISQLTVEVEAFKAIVDALASVPRTLTSIQM
jgi:hypothetical protein